MGSIARPCDGCKQYSQVEIISSGEILCPHCKKKWGTVSNPEQVFESCPVCNCSQFYTQKDFNQALGCLVMLVGIILVPFTYGLSLPLFALLDWFLHRKVPTLVTCYQCGSEFRGFPIPKHFKNFMHHIGLKYDKTRK